MRASHLAVVLVASLLLAPAAASAQTLPAPATAAPDDGTPPVPRWQSGDPIPPGYHRTQRFRGELALAGAAAFLLSYAPMAYDGVQNGDTVLTMPFVGPFLEIGFIGIPRGNGSTLDAIGQGMFAIVDLGLALDGVVQIASAVLLVVGVTVPKTVLVRDEIGAIQSLRVVPMAAGNTGGLGLAGVF